MNFISERAEARGYAKINLHLDVTGREESGYHSVETVMQSISLWDEISVTLTDGIFSAECNVDGVPADNKNIAVRAAELFMSEIGSSRGAVIKIEKRIPMAAGMAGGSADAAATLVALNSLLDTPLDRAELCRMGARLGADVPFCIVGGIAYADGRGDILHPFPEMPDCFIVAACGGEGVSTPWGYGLLDSLYGGFGEASAYIPRGTDSLKKAIEDRSLDGICKNIYNIFEAPVLDARPTAAEIKKLLLDGGALGAMMSGSGPSVFGIFEDEKTAKRAADSILDKGFFAAVCTPLKKG